MSEQQVSSTIKVKNIVSLADHAELEKAYSFVPPSSSIGNDNNNHALSGSKSNGGGGNNTWQERMVQRYHEGLYKEYALADLSRPGQLGLRWRTKQEVVDGRGEQSCGNKICRIQNDLITLEVPFSYQERGVAKKELVKLRLCPVCRPMVNNSRKRNDPSTSTDGRRGTEREACEPSDASHDAETSSSSSSSSRHRRKRKRRKKERSRSQRKKRIRDMG
jgi:protein FRA10AC1